MEKYDSLESSEEPPIIALKRAHGWQDCGDHGVQHGHREGDGARHGAEGRQGGNGLQASNFTPFTPTLIF